MVECSEIVGVGHSMAGKIDDDYEIGLRIEAFEDWDFDKIIFAIYSKIRQFFLSLGVSVE